MKPTHRMILGSLGALFFLFMMELGDYGWVYSNALSGAFPSVDMVVVYSGGGDRLNFIRALDRKGNLPLFLFSGVDYSQAALEKSLHLGDRMVVEERAQTTDQNARYCAPLILKSNARRVVLALPWYQLPRALFLTDLYLINSNVSVVPYATLPVPNEWWKSPDFYRELVKFWGSLGRIALHGVGFDRPLFHA